MQIVILCGGFAKRLGNLTKKKPKSLIKFVNKKFIIYQIELLKSYGFKNFLLCVGHFNKQIVNELGNGAKLDVNISYSYDGKKLLGTAGSLKKAYNQLGKSFILLNGDSYINFDPNKLIYRYKTDKKNIILVKKNSNQNLISNIILNKKLIVGYCKKGIKDSQYIDIGMQILNSNIFDLYLKKNKYYDLEFIYKLLIKKNLLTYYKTNASFFEIGSFKGINDFNNFLLTK
jgi:NDP-sugar pyrophosphorylase family protein